MNSGFLFQLDDQVFDLPWSYPDIYRLKLWYQDLQRAVDLDDYRLLLFGGAWSHPSGCSKDQDIFLIPPDDQIDLNDVASLRKIHQIIATGIELAINHHRFLLDFTLSQSRRLFSVFDAYQQYEVGKIDKICDPPNTSTGYHIYRMRRKAWGEELQFAHEAEFTRAFDLGDGRFLYEKPAQRILHKQARYIRNGRVYHRPIFLDELFRQRDQS